MTDSRYSKISGVFDTREELKSEVIKLKALGLTSSIIAKRTGVSRSTISRISHGDAHLAAIEPSTNKSKLREMLDSLWPVPPSILEKHNDNYTV